VTSIQRPTSPSFARARDSIRLTAAADEMNVAIDDIVPAAGRIGNWRDGVASPEER
jgi:hypothetical protein